MLTARSHPRDNTRYSSRYYLIADVVQVTHVTSLPGTGQLPAQKRPGIDTSRDRTPRAAGKLLSGAVWPHGVATQGTGPPWAPDDRPPDDRPSRNRVASRPADGWLASSTLAAEDRDGHRRAGGISVANLPGIDTDLRVVAHQPRHLGLECARSVPDNVLLS